MIMEEERMVGTVKGNVTGSREQDEEADGGGEQEWLARAPLETLEPAQVLEWGRMGGRESGTSDNLPSVLFFSPRVLLK